jgi:ribosomal protein L37AE/L43A
MSEREELLPCPCCGGKAHTISTGAIWVKCDQCGLQTLTYGTRKGAWAAWNRRQPPAPVQVSEAMVEAVADAIEGAQFGYSCRLTSLVNGVSTYTLIYDDPDDAGPFEFTSMDDAHDHINKRKRRLQALAALEAALQAGVPGDDAMDRQKALDELASESQRLGLYDVQRPTPPAKD